MRLSRSSSAARIAVLGLDRRCPAGSGNQLRAKLGEAARPACSDFAGEGLERPQHRRQIAAEPVELVGKPEPENGHEPVAGQHALDEPLMFPRREDVRQKVAQQEDERDTQSKAPGQGTTRGDDPCRVGCLAAPGASRAACLQSSQRDRGPGSTIGRLLRTGVRFEPGCGRRPRNARTGSACHPAR